MNDQDLDAWLAGLDTDARSRVETAATLDIALRFSEQARGRAENAEADLVAAIGRAERARDYLNRTTETLAQAIRLHAMGRR